MNDLFWIRDEGFCAQIQGKRLSSNPYHPTLETEKYESWREGWYACAESRY